MDQDIPRQFACSRDDFGLIDEAKSLFRGFCPNPLPHHNDIAVDPDG
jgi:hypothetical protein